MASVWTPDMAPLAASFFAQRCNWQTLPAFAPHQICLGPSTDKISGTILRRGKWDDCDPLIQEWRAGSSSAGNVFVEVGGNIGACTLTILAATSAVAHIFEPNPEALFYMTNTLHAAARLDASLLSRVHVYPVAAGAVQATSTVYPCSKNLGFAQVGVRPKCGWKEEVLRPHDVMVLPVDAVLPPAALVARLIKLDVEGYECRALLGMPRLLSRSCSIFTETVEMHLRRQNCSKDGLLRQLTRAGFRKERLLPNDGAVFRQAQVAGCWRSSRRGTGRRSSASQGHYVSNTRE